MEISAGSDIIYDSEGTDAGTDAVDPTAIAAAAAVTSIVALTALTMLSSEPTATCAKAWMEPLVRMDGRAEGGEGEEEGEGEGMVVELGVMMSELEGLEGGIMDGAVLFKPELGSCGGIGIEALVVGDGVGRIGGTNVLLSGLLLFVLLEVVLLL